MVLVALYFKHELIKLSHPLSLSFSPSLSIAISLLPLLFFRVSKYPSNENQKKTKQRAERVAWMVFCLSLLECSKRIGIATLATFALVFATKCVLFGLAS